MTVSISTMSKILGLFALTGTVVGLVTASWGYVTSDFARMKDLRAMKYEQQLDYSTLRLEEYQAVEGQKRNTTWSMRVGAHKERVRIICDELYKMDVPNRTCDNQ